MYVTATEFHAISKVMGWFMRKPKFFNNLDDEEAKELRDAFGAMRSCMQYHEADIKRYLRDNGLFAMEICNEFANREEE